MGRGKGSESALTVHLPTEARLKLDITIYLAEGIETYLDHFAAY